MLFSESLANPRFQLLATAVLSGAAVASLILGYQALEREERLTELKKSIPSLADERRPTNQQQHQQQPPPPLNGIGGPHDAPDEEDARNLALARRAQAGDFDEELIAEQLARNRAFLTPEGLEKLRESFVIVVGCGGVGSHCAAALARSGVSRLRLIDFDQVTLSSLNRHAVATLADVGTPKVQCLRRRLIAIAPWVQFDLRQAKFDGGVAGQMLAAWEDGRAADFIVDAIDNIDTKVSLLKYCYEHGLPVVSAMGAGCKSDPTRIAVGDIGASKDDRLSRATRRRLKLLGITSGIPTVYSTEQAGLGKAELLPLPEDELDKGAVGDLGVMANFRVRILPVLGTMPAIFGLTVANHIMLSLTDYPIDYVPAKGRDKMYEGILTYVQASEEKLARLSAPEDAVGLKTPLTAGDVSFLAEELYHARSAVSGITTKLVLIRWRRPDKTNVNVLGEGSDVQKWSTVRLRDLVCMTKEEATRHANEVFVAGKAPEQVYDGETIARIEAKLAEAAQYERYRW
ncbi:hypothetical protein CDD83_3141 [Cordyceps sp. RAO-2017]|nr:hypothetical protein CDD83_3141 [Cordyceps sp. RAO-2017]